MLIFSDGSTSLVAHIFTFTHYSRRTTLKHYKIKIYYKISKAEVQIHKLQCLILPVSLGQLATENSHLLSY